MSIFRRRARGTVGLVAAAAFVLTGCSASGSSESDGSPTVVNVWHGFTEADGKVVQAIADDFNDSQSQYEVKIEVNPWNVISDKLLPALKSGNGPDLVVQTVDAAQGYVKQKAFAPLQDFYDDPDNETDTYHPHVVEYTEFDGEQFGVPMGYAPFSIWYNKQMFADAGITEFPETWDELIALAEQLTTPEIFGLSLADKQSTFLPTILQSGGGEVVEDGEIVLDTPQNVETLEWWRDQYAKGWTPTNIGLADAVALFTGGKAAMTWIGPWVVTGADAAGIEVGEFPAPAGSEKVATPAAANYWWLTSQGADDADVKAGAEAFLAYFNSHDAQVRWALEANYPPNRTDVTVDELAENPLIAALTPEAKDAYIALATIPGGATDVNAELDTLSVHIASGSGGDVASLVKEADKKLKDIVAPFQ
ncbi:ABC transporter substrate-binding protein [Microbacterium sp. NPDC056234]|uniref:ABC transporter substrate-binding protein n=1 Tax=Microbacterium sp. NPDC056234 TaxID=3345757 RepID=UPI0035E37587